METAQARNNKNPASSPNSQGVKLPCLTSENLRSIKKQSMSVQTVPVWNTCSLNGKPNNRNKRVRPDQSRARNSLADNPSLVKRAYFSVVDWPDKSDLQEKHKTSQIKSDYQPGNINNGYRKWSSQRALYVYMHIAETLKIPGYPTTFQWTDNLQEKEKSP